MTALQKIDGRAGFDQKKNLRRLLDRGEAGEWLFDLVIECMEVFAAQALHEMTLRISDNHSDVDAVNADVNRFLRLLRIFLGIGERTRPERCG